MKKLLLMLCLILTSAFVRAQNVQPAPCISTVAFTYDTLVEDDDGDYTFQMHAIRTFNSGSPVEVTSSTKDWTSSNPDVLQMQSTLGQAKFFGNGDSTVTVDVPIYEGVGLVCALTYVTYTLPSHWEFATESAFRVIGASVPCVGDYCVYPVTPVCSNLPVDLWPHIDLNEASVVSSKTNPPLSWQAYSICSRYVLTNPWSCLPPINIPPAKNPTLCTYNP
jgi:hypothetical protein